MIVTTSSRVRDEEERQARALATRWGLTFAPRADIPRDQPVLACTAAGLRLVLDGRAKPWHPAMFHALRASGEKHPLVHLTDAAPGDTVVDCTLGLGVDARFLSHWTGTRVTALEVVPVLAALTADGLERVGADVEVVVTDATTWLAGRPDDSVDLVVADPMFPDGRNGGNTSLDVVRWAGESRPLDAAWRDQALRVARKAVVVRDAWESDLLERLEAPHIDARWGRTTRYGLWRQG